MDLFLSKANAKQQKIFFWGGLKLCSLEAPFVTACISVKAAYNMKEKMLL